MSGSTASAKSGVRDGIRPQNSERYLASELADPSGTQCSKTFQTTKGANRLLAEVEASKSRDAYVSPHAGCVLFRDHAAKWMQTRRTQTITSAHDASVMRTHVLPRWGSWQLRKIDHMEVQTWVTELGRQRSRWVVAKALQLMSNVMRSAVRSKLSGTNPCDDVIWSENRQLDTDERIINRRELRRSLLPQVPQGYRALSVPLADLTPGARSL